MDKLPKGYKWVAVPPTTYRTAVALADTYLTEPPARKRAWTSVLLVDFIVRKQHPNIDVFPALTRATYHTVIVNGLGLTRRAFDLVYPLAERVLHVDGVHLPRWQVAGAFRVNWHQGVTHAQRTPCSTLFIKPGWYGKCHNCGECCSNVGMDKGLSVLQTLDVPCRQCHGSANGPETSCPHLIVQQAGTRCRMYHARPSCCRNYPARNPNCSYITPTCGLFTRAYIQSTAEFEAKERDNDAKQNERK